MFTIYNYHYLHYIVDFPTFFHTSIITPTRETKPSPDQLQHLLLAAIAHSVSLLLWYLGFIVANYRLHSHKKKQRIKMLIYPYIKVLNKHI